MERRDTIQRKIILDTVRLLKNHPTADEVYLAIHKEYPNISRTTVYRNLNYLSQEGILYKIYGHSADRFDHNTHDHAHILCNECGSFEDFEHPEIESLKEYVTDHSGYDLTGQSIVFVGKCPKCKVGSNC